MNNNCFSLIKKEYESHQRRKKIVWILVHLFVYMDNNTNYEESNSYYPPKSTIKLNWVVLNELLLVKLVFPHCSPCKLIQGTYPEAVVTL